MDDNRWTVTPPPELVRPPRSEGHGPRACSCFGPDPGLQIRGLPRSPSGATIFYDDSQNSGKHILRMATSLYRITIRTGNMKRHRGRGPEGPRCAASVFLVHGLGRGRLLAPRCVTHQQGPLSFHWGLIKQAGRIMSSAIEPNPTCRLSSLPWRSGRLKAPTL